MSDEKEGTTVKGIDFHDLEWSPAPFRVDEFLKRFSLPQIVKVNEGYYGENEDSSLGADQVLTLHLVKSIERVMGHDYRGKEVNIPLNCPNKVEIRPSNSKDVYESVEELCSLFPSHVRISQGYYSVERDEEILNVGDKLRLLSFDKHKNGPLLCVNQNGTKLELARDCIAGFQPLADGNEYYLAEVVKRFTLPLYVQFVDPPVVGGREARADYHTSFNSSLGPIYLESKYTENLVIASAVSGDGSRTVVTFPRDFDIRIAVCEGMLRNSPKYTKLCKIVNEGVDLASLRRIDTYGALKPRNSIKEYKYKELVTYSQPNVPPRLQTVSENAGKSQEAAKNHKEDKVRHEKAKVSKPEVNSAPEVPKPEENEPGVEKLEVKQEENRGENKNTHKEVLEQVEVEEMRRCSSTGAASSAKPALPKKPMRKQNSLNGLEKKEGTKQGESIKEATFENKPAILNGNQNEEGARTNGQVAAHESLAVPEDTAPDLSNYSIKNVSEMLRELGMSKYVVKFEAEKIDGEILKYLTDEILMVDFGMNKLHCMKLRKYLGGWRPKV